MCGSRRFAESDQTMISVAYFFESWNNEGALGVLKGAEARLWRA